MQVSEASKRILAELLKSQTGQDLPASRRWRIGSALSGLSREHGIADLDRLITMLALSRRSSLAHKLIEALLQMERDGAIMARNLLAKANIQPGQKVLINGASGSIGAAAVQLARHAGAEVTGVCSTRRLEYVEALGADTVIDYKVEEFTANGETYDLIFDVLGRSSFGKCAGSLKPGGIYLLASFKSNALWQMLRTSLGGDKKVICALASEQPGDLDFVRELIEAGQYKAIVDKCFPLDEAAAAHRYVEDGLKQGAVVIGVAPNGRE